MSGKILEDDLWKALDELETSVGLKKGDPLVSADPDGGFSTEGTPLNRGGKGALSKQMSASDMSQPEPGGDEEESGEEDESAPEPGGDEESEEEQAPPMGKGTRTKKSFAQEAASNEALVKGIDVSNFLESLVDQVGDSIDKITRTVDSVDDRINKSERRQSGFNKKLAKAISVVGRAQLGIIQVLRAMSGRPAEPIRKSVLNPSEVHQPPLRQEEGRGPTRQQVARWLGDQAEKGLIPDLVVSEFEMTGSISDPNIRKALENTLMK